MNLQMETRDSIRLLRIKDKRVDAANSPHLKKELFTIIEEGGAFFAIDLSLVKFIDSSGLGAMVSALKRIGQNGKIGLWGLSQEVKALFELTQLYEVFDIFETEEDAIRMLSRNVSG